jgi:hypothetical protein
VKRKKPRSRRGSRDTLVRPPLPAPHERDESANAREAQSPRSPRRRRIAQGERDVAAGLRDTERRGIPSDLPAPPRPRRRSAR